MRIFSPLFGPSITLPSLSVNPALIACDIMPITLAHAMAQMLTLMLPSGALGNDKIHSM